jgi:hypothetical protein
VFVTRDQRERGRGDEDEPTAASERASTSSHRLSDEAKAVPRTNPSDFLIADELLPRPHTM